MKTNATTGEGDIGFWMADGRFVPCIVVRPIASKPPSGVTFGARYGRPYRRQDGKLVWMFRKGQRVRFFLETGKEVGVEQRNVVPAVLYAQRRGWIGL